MNDISLDLVRVTEAAAIAASAWVGSGDKESADRAATDAMRERLNQMDFAAKIMIGEGKKDKSSGLFGGETVGRLSGEKGAQFHELAVDPIDGTRPTVTSGPEAMSVLAVGEEGSLFSTPEFYMNKLAYGPEIARKVRLRLADPLEKTIRLVSEAAGKDPKKIVVCVLDRPRHEKMIAELRRLGVRIKLIQDCDVSGAIACCLPASGIDLLCGIGGAPEGIITACAMKCLQGGLEVQVMRKDCSVADPKFYAIGDLVRGPCVFAATGITDGSLLRGVRFTSQGPVTNSVFMRSVSGTVRWLVTYHGSGRQGSWGP
jgi:fructose-1,6-bisphosphatase II